MKKVVSIALFGEGDKYTQYLPSFVIAHLNLFPINRGWVLRVHCDEAVGKSATGQALDRLAARDLIELRHMAMPPVLTKAMLWRMAPVFDTNCEYVFCRDIDACPMPRDRAICEQFIASGCTVHTCHDNLAHTGIMGGLCGFQAPSFREITKIRALEELYERMAQTDEQWAVHGNDQIALNRLLDRQGAPSLLEHRFNGWTAGLPTDFQRVPSRYSCNAYSAPTPDKGVSRFQGDLAVRADQLANHLGAAGYDHGTAYDFYAQHGDKEIALALAACLLGVSQ